MQSVEFNISVTVTTDSYTVVLIIGSVILLSVSVIWSVVVYQFVAVTDGNCVVVDSTEVRIGFNFSMSSLSSRDLRMEVKSNEPKKSPESSFLGDNDDDVPENLDVTGALKDGFSLVLLLR